MNITTHLTRKVFIGILFASFIFGCSSTKDSVKNDEPVFSESSGSSSSSPADLGASSSGRGR